MRFAKMIFEVFRALLLVVYLITISKAHPIQQRGVFTFMNENSSVTIDLHDKTSLELRFKSVVHHGTLLRIGYNKITVVTLLIDNDMGLVLQHWKHDSGPTRAIPFTIKVKDMAWHALSLNIENEGLRLSIDGQNAFVHHRINAQEHGHGWKVLMGKVAVHTTDPNTFIGCIDIKEPFSRAKEIIHTESVRHGCFDACSVQTCHNGGVCMNHITTAVCDCQGTGYEGPNCQQASMAISLDQRSYISMDVSRNPSLTTGDILQTRLRTRQNEGLLLHTRFQSGHLILAVAGGAIRIDITLNHKKLSGIIGDNVKINDGQWHFFELRVVGKYMLATIDRKVVWKSKWCSQAEAKDISNKINLSGNEEVVYLGGASLLSKMPHVREMKNFVGDIQQTRFNGLDVIKKLLFEDDWRFTHVGHLPSHVGNH